MAFYNLGAIFVLQVPYEPFGAVVNKGFACGMLYVIFFMCRSILSHTEDENGNCFSVNKS